jgi:hypothetical protein
MWLNIATSNGHKGAEKERDKVRFSLMNHTQAEKAQQRARLCVKSKYKQCK